MEIYSIGFTQKQLAGIAKRQDLALLAERKIEEALDRSLFSVPTVLLCSEPTPGQCTGGSSSNIWARNGETSGPPTYRGSVPGLDLI